MNMVTGFGCMANGLAGSIVDRHRGVGIFLFFGIALLSVGCTSEPASRSTSDGGGPSVVATTSILADLVRTIGGSHVSVESLMGPGVDPHLYKASEGDVMRMAAADLVIGDLVRTRDAGFQPIG